MLNSNAPRPPKKFIPRPTGLQVQQIGPQRRNAPKGIAAKAGLPISLLLPCCGIGALLLIASAIVLSLIPVYLPNSSAPAVRLVQRPNTVRIARNTIIRVGALNAAQRELLRQDILARLRRRRNVRNVRIISAIARRTTRGIQRRQDETADVVDIIIEIDATDLDDAAIQELFADLADYVIPVEIAIQIESVSESPLSSTSAPTSSSTAPTDSTTTASNQTRALSRRSINEGGAPSGILYIDAHRVAGTHGNATSVSFYVDHTCASATIEFGAFELLTRDLVTNTAELVLKQRSGPITLGNRRDLKPFMSLITIRLCSGNGIEDLNSGGCQGRVFPVMAHQYIGIRSDHCKLGFADPPKNPVFATTWVAQHKNIDVFSEPYPRVNYIPADHIVLQSVTIESVISEATKETSEYRAGTTNGPRALFIGSYTPRRCGLAKFLEDLTESYPGQFGVVAVDEDPSLKDSRVYSDKVVARLNFNDRDAYYQLADMFNQEPYDVVNIQHEYSLYGGMAGEYILAFMAAVRKPIILTMHTVIPEPNTIYMSITRAVCSLSSRIVVMAELGRRLLVEVYGIDETKIFLLPHGVPDVPLLSSLSEPKSQLGLNPNSPTIATFGLLHRNKNIEFALKALKKVVQTVPSVMYLIVGQTHPTIQIYEGESYRKELTEYVTQSGLTNNVKFINRFVNDTELIQTLMAADIYLTPYAREDQYVSGTLSWAVGMGKAVVSTPYMYAKELLNDGRGFLVPFEDEEVLGSTLIRIIQQDSVREAAREKAYEFGRHMTWPRVSQQLLNLFSDLLLYS